MYTRILSLLLLLIIFLHFTVQLPYLSADNGGSFYWAKPGTHATYCSKERLGIAALRDIRVSDKIVYTIIRHYLAEICFKWSILDVHDNLALINFTIVLSNIERESTELSVPYTLEKPDVSYMYPPIPAAKASNIMMNVTRIHYNITSLTLSRNITVNLDNMKAYYNGEYVGQFLFAIPLKVIAENKPLTLYTVTSDFKKWNLKYKIEEGELEKYVYVAMANLGLLQELGENASFKIGSTILGSSRLLRTCSEVEAGVRNPWLKRMYYEENKTLISYVYHPVIPKMYYDTLSGILVAIALEEPVSEDYIPEEVHSWTLESDLLYNLFNITYISFTTEFESPEYVVDGFYRVEIRLVDTNIPLEKPVFGKVEGYGEEYSLLKVLLFSLAFVLALVIVLFRRFR